MDIHLAAVRFYEDARYMRGISKDTIRNYRHVINYYTRLANVTTLDQITPDSIRNWFFNGRMNSGWRAATFLSYKKSLKVFFMWCIKQGYMTENPIADLASPKLEKHLPRHISKEDASKLLEGVYNYPYEDNYVRMRNHAIFATVIFAGLRKKEILNLRYTDVDLKTLTVLVCEGKGKKDRVIPISHALAVSLERYLAIRKQRNITCPNFFVSRGVNTKMSEITLKRIVEQIRGSTHIYFTLHHLRHTFATLMIQGGCDIYSLSRMMGHEDLSTTLWYLHATTDHLKSQMMKHPLH